LSIDPLPASLIGAELAELTTPGDQEALDQFCNQLEFDCGPAIAISQPSAGGDHEGIRRLIAAARAAAQDAHSPRASAAP
jgi:hypothetical protein